MNVADLRQALTLGWRNVWRNRRRSLVSMSAIALGLTLVLIFNSIIDRALGDAKTQLDNSGLGHVEITAKGWRAHHAVGVTLSDVDAVVAHLALPAGSEVGARLVTRALLTAAHGNVAVEVHGVDWRDEAALAEYAHSFAEGSAPADDDAGIVVGDKLAKRLGLRVGHKLRLTTQRADGEMGAALFRVRGIFHALSSSIAEHRVLVSRGALGDALGTPGAAHQVVIQLARPDEAAAVAAAAAAANPGLECLPYTTIVPIYATMESLTGSVNFVGAFFVYFLVGLGILNTTLMSVMERTRELGVMQALGTRPAGIVAIILAESFWIASISVVIGLVLGLGVCWLGSDGTLLDYSKEMGDGIEFGGTVMRSAFSTAVAPRDAIVPALFVYVMALVVGIYPAWRVTRLHVVDALRNK